MRRVAGMSWLFGAIVIGVAVSWAMAKLFCPLA